MNISDMSADDIQKIGYLLTDVLSEGMTKTFDELLISKSELIDNGRTHPNLVDGMFRIARAIESLAAAVDGVANAKK